MAAALEVPEDPKSESWPLLGAEEANKVLNLGYTLAPDEKVIRCPYDPHHWVRISRTMSHLYRCRRNYRNMMEAKGEEIVMKTCRFNECHVMAEPEIPYHEPFCSYRHKSFKDELATIKRISTPVHHDDSLVLIKDEDMWYTDPNIRSYDPRIKLREEFFYIPHRTAGMTKSMKKQFDKEATVQFLTRASAQPWGRTPPGEDKPVVELLGPDHTFGDVISDIIEERQRREQEEVEGGKVDPFLAFKGQESKSSGSPASLEPEDKE